HLNDSLHLGNTQLSLATASAAMSADVVISIAGQPHAALADLLSSAQVNASPGSLASLEFDSSSDTAGNQHVSIAWPNLDRPDDVTSNLQGTDPSLDYWHPHLSGSKTNDAPASPPVGLISPRGNALSGGLRPLSRAIAKG